MAEDIDVDKLYDDAMGEETQGELPMEDAPQGEEPKAETPQIPEIEFSHKDKKIKTRWDDPNVKTWISQGYDYGQRMGQFHQERESFLKDQAAFNERTAKYKEINEWAEKNPQQWETLFGLYQKAINGQGTQAQAQQIAQLPPEILQKLERAEKFITEQETKAESQRIQQEDSEFDDEVKSVREQYPHIDFDAETHDGKSLYYRVLEYGTQRGIRSFTDAFYAFNHKDLSSLAEERGKESVAKDIQRKQKLGILGQTSTPTKGLQATKNISSKSYDDILGEIKEEYHVS